jgi:hypothetical protein
MIIVSTTPKMNVFALRMMMPKLADVLAGLVIAYIIEIWMGNVQVQSVYTVGLITVLVALRRLIYVMYLMVSFAVLGALEERRKAQIVKEMGVEKPEDLGLTPKFHWTLRFFLDSKSLSLGSHHSDNTDYISITEYSMYDPRTATVKLYHFVAPGDKTDEDIKAYLHPNNIEDALVFCDTPEPVQAVLMFDTDKRLHEKNGLEHVENQLIQLLGPGNIHSEFSPELKHGDYRCVMLWLANRGHQLQHKPLVTESNKLHVLSMDISWKYRNESIKTVTYDEVKKLSDLFSRIK